MVENEKKTIYQSVLKGTIFVGLGNLTLLVLGVLSTMIAVRKLSQWDFGIFILIQTVAALVAQVSSMGLEMAAAKFLSGVEEDQDREKIIQTSILTRIGIILCFSLIYLLFQPFINQLFNITISRSYIPILLLFSLQSFNGQLKAILQGLFRFANIGAGGVIESIFNFLFIIGFVVFARMNLWGLILAKVFAQIIACCYLVRYISIKRLFFDSSVFIRLIKFGFPLELNEILGFTYQRVDTLIIGILMTPTQIAYLAVARKIPDSLSGLFEAFRSAYFPHVSQLNENFDKKTVGDVINQVVKLLSFLTFLLCLGLIVWGSSIIVILFTDKYYSSTLLFQLLIVALALGFVNNIYGTSLVAIGQSDKPPLINAVHSATSIISNLILIPRFGVLGAGLSNLLGNVITNPLNFFFVARSKIPVSVKSYFIPLCIFLSCILIYGWFGSDQWGVTILLFLFYVGCSVLFSVIRVSDIRTLLRSIPFNQVWSHGHHIKVNK